MGTAVRSMFRAIAVTAVVAVTAGAAIGSPADSQQAAANYAAMEDLPTEAADVTDIERTAIELAYELDAVAVSAEQYDITCPLDRLAVSWEEPVGYEVGTLVTPVGPAPGPDTREVNGIVVCSGSDYAFMGFQAQHDDQWGWRITAVPNFGDNRAEEPQPLELRYLDDLDPLFGSLADLGPVDDYAPYQPQRLCHSLPKPGAVALAKLLLDAYPDTTSYGIGRACDAGPRSEHKEGRAFDWGAGVRDDREAAAVEDLLQRLLATDQDGNEHALARRLGVMYIIWDGHIWSSYRAADGWRPYSGPSAHTDHVHISLSWDGALGRTSLWQVAMDGLDLRDFQIGYLGDLPPATGPLRDSMDTRRQLLRDRAADQRSASEEGDGTDEQGDGTDEQGDDGTADGPAEGTVGEDGTTDDVTDTVEDTTDDLGDTVDDTTDTVDDTLDDVTDPIGNPLDDTVDDTTDTVTDTVDDPLDGGAGPDHAMAQSGSPTPV